MRNKCKGEERKIIPFKESEIENLLSVIKPFALFKDLDKENVFGTEKFNKGILGHVIEKSVLNIPINSFQNADIKIIYGKKEVLTEVKTTGVHDRELLDGETYHAKECTSLTAVSIGCIEDETWEKSHFYEKIAHLLWVFYIYKRDEGEEVVPYKKYAQFPVLGYKFTHLEDFPEDLEKFKSDWNRTRIFLKNAKEKANPEELYPQLHSAIKKDLFFVDIAPRYRKEKGKSPVLPRFRIKKPYVNSVFQRFWNELQGKTKRIAKCDQWEKNCSSFAQLEQDLYKLTKDYKNKSIEEILQIFEMNVPSKINKSIAEQIFVKMIGCEKSRKISDIDLFNSVGIIAKTITITKKGARTEDTKLFTMNLDEIKDKDLAYEDTSFYHYFNDYQFLCIVFEEPQKGIPLEKNRFIGIKRLVFPDIQDDIQNIYIKHVI